MKPPITSTIRSWWLLCSVIRMTFSSENLYQEAFHHHSGFAGELINLQNISLFSHVHIFQVEFTRSEVFPFLTNTIYIYDNLRCLWPLPSSSAYSTTSWAAKWNANNSGGLDLSPDLSMLHHSLYCSGTLCHWTLQPPLRPGFMVATT